MKWIGSRALSSLLVMSGFVYACVSSEEGDGDSNGTGGSPATEAGAKSNPSDSAGAGGAADGGRGAGGNEPIGQPVAGEGGGGGAASGGEEGGGAGETSAGASALGGSGGGNNGSGGEAGVNAPPTTGELQGPEGIDETALVVTHEYLIGTGESFVGDIVSDADGNIFVGLSRAHSGSALGGIERIAKYDADLSEQWVADLYDNPNVQLVGARVNSIAVNAGGELFYAGTDAADAVVGKLDTGGQLDWEEKWSSSEPDVAIGVLPTEDGIFAAGYTNGQAPGNPPGGKSGPWLARYEQDGTRSWLKQYAPRDLFDPIRDAGIQFFAANDDGFVYSTRDAVIAFEPDGSERWRAELPGVSTHEDFYFTYGWSVFHRESSTFYNLAPFWVLGPLSSDTEERPALSNYDTSWELLWKRVGEAPRTAVIEPVEGIEWTGKFYTGSTKTGGPLSGYGGGGHRIAVTSDAVFILGIYGNSYKNGATPRTPTNPAFVARYTLTGERVWFRQYRFEPVEGGAPTDPQSHPEERAGLVVDADGNLVVGVNTYQAAFLFRLHGNDGSIL